MSNHIITDSIKNLQYTEYTNVIRPWRIDTTYVYHEGQSVVNIGCEPRPGSRPHELKKGPEESMFVEICCQGAP